MAATRAFQWAVPKRTGVCEASGEPLQAGSTVYSFVYETEEGWLRKDYSEAGWDSVGKDACTELAGVHWKSTLPMPEKKPEKPEDRDRRAVEVLKALAHQPETVADAFILSLFLRRRRRLLLKKVFKKEDKEFHLFEIAGSSEIVPIQQVELSAIETESVQRRLAERLQQSA